MNFVITFSAAGAVRGIKLLTKKRAESFMSLNAIPLKKRWVKSVRGKSAYPVESFGEARRAINASLTKQYNCKQCMIVKFESFTELHCESGYLFPSPEIVTEFLLENA